MAGLTAAGRVLWALLALPLLLVEMAAVALILLGAGRAYGMPLLFWHERRGPQALAGMATALLAGEVLFVAYLATADGRAAMLPPVGVFLAAGMALWAVVVAGAALWRVVAWRRARAGKRTTGITPGFRTVHGQGPGRLVVAHPSIVPFVGGVVAGMAAVALLARTVARFGTVAAHVVTWSPAWFPIRVLDVYAAFVFGVVLIAYWLVPPVATPAVGVCMLFALLAAAYGFVVHWLGSAGLAILILAVILLIAGLPRYKIRIPGLTATYDAPVPYPPPASGRSSGALLHARAGVPTGQPRPLILVCASGGGIRAATWTAAILDRLQRVSGFTPAVRLITGASGGMVGAAFWVAALYDVLHGHPPASAGELPRRVGRDGLTSVANRLVFRDLPYAVLPAVNQDDRGRALELSWIEHGGRSLAIPLAALRDLERAGRLPSLVFSPMIVEDGRRLVITNVDLTAVLANRVRWIGNDGLGDASLSSFHVDDVVPGALDVLSLATAARMSASFPYVSPATCLPTTPRRRVVDAGYYDNYGLSLACEWLRELVANDPQWVRDNVSAALVLQIRDNVSELSVHPDGDRARVAADPGAAPARADTPGAALARGLEWLTSPVSGVFAAREAVMLFRNDAALEAATALCDQQLRSGFLTTTIFEFKGEASLSWYLAGEEIDGLCAQATSPGIDGKIADVAAWLAAHA